MVKSDIARRVDRVFSDGSLVEIKENLKSARDLRNALLQAVRLMVENPGDRQVVLVLGDPVIGSALIEKEVNTLKSALLPELSDRLAVCVIRGGEVLGMTKGRTLGPLEPDELDCLNGFWEGEPAAVSAVTLPRPDLQSEVFRVLLRGWVLGQGPLTSVELEDSVGCSYRTVATAVKALGPLIGRMSDKRVYLKRFPEAAWGAFVAGAAKSRNSQHFVDQSGQPRSIEFLLRRFQKLGLSEVAVGGVFGAKNYFPDLDIVGSPRLDLCVHTPAGEAELSFVEQLDPGLKKTEDAYAPARVVLHFLRRKRSFFDQVESDLYADPIECLADLSAGRLVTQAAAFGQYLISRGGELSGTE